MIFIVFAICWILNELEAPLVDLGDDYHRVRRQGCNQYIPGHNEVTR